jgi:hypothetical protein
LPVELPGVASPAEVPPNNPPIASPPGRYSALSNPNSTPPAYSSLVYWPASPSGQGASQALRQQYLELAEQQVGRMTDDELKQGIAEMRRQFLIAQLKTFAASSPDRFDGTRVEIAIVALKAKDAQDIQRLVDSLPGRLEDALRSRTRTERKTESPRLEDALRRTERTTEEAQPTDG